MAFQTLAIKDGAGTSQTAPVHIDAAGSVIPVHSTDGSLATYRAGAVTQTPVATPTTWARIKWVSGVARIRRIVMSGIATAAGNLEILITKRSTLGTNNASSVWTAVTGAPMDSGNAVASSVVEVLTGANQDALGSSVGVLAAGRLQLTADGSGVAIIPFDVAFGTGGQQAPVLRAANENITIGFNGDAVPSGGKIDFYVEWTEAAAG